MQQHRIVLACLAALALGAPACSTIVSPDPGRFGAGDGGGPGELDAGRIEIDGGGTERDAGPPGIDGGPIGIDGGPIEIDAGPIGTDGGPPPVDAGPPPVDSGIDSGPPPCTEGSAVCEGETRVVCRGGTLVREDCAAMGAFCEAGMCRPRVCTPGSRMCSWDRRSSIECNDRGSASTTTMCSTFCEGSTGACSSGSTGCFLLPSIGVGGSQRFDLCDETDGDTYTPGGGCPASTRANAGDRTFQLRIDRTQTVLIDLRDVDSGAAIDTVVYVRRTCDDASTQLGCDDDVPCAESDITTGCSGEVQVRQSRLVLTLEPGTYYIVADAIGYDSFGCGLVELRVIAR